MKNDASSFAPPVFKSFTSNGSGRNTSCLSSSEQKSLFDMSHLMLRSLFNVCNFHASTRISDKILV